MKLLSSWHTPSVTASNARLQKVPNQMGRLNLRRFWNRLGLSPERIANRLGFQIARHRISFTPKDLELMEKVRPFTGCSLERIVNVADSVKYVVSNRLPGAFVECGVFRGGSVMAALFALQERGDLTRDFYLYDTFEGMSEPTKADLSFDGLDAQTMMADPNHSVWCRSGIDEVRRNVLTTGYPKERIRLVKGKVEDTIPGNVPEQIAYLRLDTDWYESTRHELVHLYPRLCPHGVLIIDDYGHWQGARKAVDEYFESQPIRPLLSRLDYTGRVTIKPNVDQTH